MMLGAAIETLHGEELDLSAAYRAVAEAHADQIDLAHLCRRFAEECQRRAEGLEPFAKAHGAGVGNGFSRRIRDEVLGGARRLGGMLQRRTEAPGAALLAELRRIYRLSSGAALDWVLLRESGHAARDAFLEAYAGSQKPEKDVELRWLKTRIRQSAVQVIVFS